MASITPAFGFTSSAYWLAVELENSSATPLEQILALSYPLLGSIDLYLDHKGVLIQQFHTGDNQPFSQRPIKHRHFLFPIHVPENSRSTLYLRIQTNGSMQLPLTLWDKQSYREADQHTSILHGLYFGMMLAMILYNLFIYISIRERSYLYYVLFVSSFAVFQLSLQGFSYHYFWPQETWLNEKALLMTVSAAQVFGGLFTLSLLELKEYNRTLYRLIRLMVFMALFTAIASIYLNYTALIILSLASSIIMAATGMVAGFLRWRRGFTPARYYTLAWLGFLIGTIAFALSKFGIIPRNLFTEYGIQLGSAIEVILLSFALANRINTARKEKEVAQTESVFILKKYQALYENAIEGMFQTTLEHHYVSVIPPEINRIYK